MDSYENCAFAVLDNGCCLLEDVVTPHGVAERIYLGSGGIYIIFSGETDPGAVYDYFRNLLCAARLKLYCVGKGEFSVMSNCFTGEAADSDVLQEDVYGFVCGMPQQYSQSAIERMKTALVKSDARTRGYYTDADGTLYLFRHGEFRRGSEIDADRVFGLCLYGGVFGLHRFALGKWVSGLVYIFTCGMFLLGWLFDLVQLFFGLQKDKRKNLLRPLTNKAFKLRLIPLGVLIALVSFVVWLEFLRFGESPISYFTMHESPYISAFL